MEALPLPEMVKHFLAQGVLGVICLALAWAYWNCRAKVDQAYKERLGDFRATLETIAANNSAISDVVEATKARTEAASAIARAQEMLATEHTKATTEIARLRETIEALHRQLHDLRMELARRGIA